VWSTTGLRAAACNPLRVVPQRCVCVCAVNTRRLPTRNRSIRPLTMKSASLLLVLGVVTIRSQSCTNKEWGQCGGQTWHGETCCPSYDTCKTINTFYAQCQPQNLCLNVMYGQCGGYDHHQPPQPWTPKYHHQTCCPDSFYCEYQSQYVQLEPPNPKAPPPPCPSLA
jgi:hypothetical protein